MRLSNQALRKNGLLEVDWDDVMPDEDFVILVNRNDKSLRR